MAGSHRRLILFSFLIFFFPVFVRGQNECPAGTMASQYSRDASGVQHQTECFNVQTGQQALPNSAVKNLNNIRFADQFAGADWIAQVNSADSDLGATAGEIWVNKNVKSGTATTALSLSANHTIRFIQGGTY